MRDALPPRQRTLIARQLRKRALLRAHLLDGVVRRALEGEPDWQRFTQRAGYRVVIEQGQRHRGLRLADCGLRIADCGLASGLATRSRRLPEPREPCAEQAVADLEPVVEKREGPIDRERGQPERQARELDGHRI